MHGCNTHHSGFRPRWAGRGSFGGGFGPSGDWPREGGYRSGGGQRGGGDDGRGRSGKRFSREELRAMVLALLDAQPQHGYQLIRAFAEKSSEAYSPSPGVIYPLLGLLEDMGLIEKPRSEAGGRNLVMLNEAGKAEREDTRAVADSAFARLAAMAEESQRSGAGPVRRAMINLRNATIQRLQKGEASETLAFAIADLLDEAARKIERIG